MSSEDPRLKGDLRCDAPTRGGTPCKQRVSRAGLRCHLHRTEGAEDDPPSSRVVIRQRAEEDKFTLLEETLARAGFWERIEEVRTDAGVDRAAFAIIIKPDLEIFDPGAPTGTDPQLVEHVVLLLHRRGYPNVAVGDALSSADLWLQNRDVPVLADLVGYRWETDDGTGYDVLNLSEDLVDAGFDQGGVLAGSTLARPWLEAHFRISMAKNKTDEALYFSLGIKNVLGVLPLRDKDYHYRHRLDQAEVCMALLDRAPVHFSIIDAVISNHGCNGSGTADPLPTNTVIASDSLLLADFAAAFKMGLDPYVSPLNGKVLRTLGLPRRYGIDGDLSTYPGWKNVPLILCDSIQHLNRSVAIAQLVRPWFQSVNPELFPFKNSIDERLNDFVGTYLSRPETNPVALSARVALNYALGNVCTLIHGYQVMYAKDRLPRRHADLAINLDDYALDDYEAIVDYIQPLAQTVAHAAPDRNGLRWRYIDHSVLFEFSRLLPIDYEQFVARVDIAAAVRLMNDNIGGACVEVAHDRQGRITHQAERNIYLPQPNWMVLFGGTNIDVGKLELIRYEPNRQQIFWRTVTSANNSALYDDGIATFEKDGDHGTRISIVARQEFTLPLFWQAINIDYAPQIKDAIVSDAYTRFFSRTMANYEAAYEGRTVGTGTNLDASLGESENEGSSLPIEQIADIVFKLAGGLAPTLTRLATNPASADHPSVFDQPALSRWFDDARSEHGEKFLTTLLQLMGLAFSLNTSLKKNLENFRGRYLFKIEDKDFAVAAHFDENGIALHRDDIEGTDVSITFKNSRVLTDFLLSPNPDILDAVLNHDVAVDGNLNYLLKLGYMTKRLQRMAMGAA